MARAQDLATTPLIGFSSLPAQPPPTLQAGAAREGSRIYLKGRYLIGVNVSHAVLADSDLDTRWKFSPAIRTTPRRTGWGPSFGLSWFKGDLSVPINGQRTTIAQLKVRPLMAGVGYTVGIGRTLVNFGLVGGYAYTSARVTAALPAGTTASIDVSRSWVVRPNVGVTHALTRRLALVGSAGYVLTKPLITFAVTQAGQEISRTAGSLRGDYANVSVGLAFSIF
jgi:hypothetical protein